MSPIFQYRLVAQDLRLRDRHSQIINHSIFLYDLHIFK